MIAERDADLDLLIALSREILDAKTDVKQLVPQIVQLVALLERNADAKFGDDLNIAVNRTELSSGVALSPFAASLCAKEVFRSAAFIKGLAGAVNEAMKSDRPVRVLYAGCGPYALIVLPLMATLSADHVLVTLIDIHEESLRSAKSLIERFGFADRVHDYVHADATQYAIPPSSMPDVIVSETMNVCLGKEPQVAITRHLLAQAPDAIMVPESISIDAALLDPSQESARALSLEAQDHGEPERIHLGNVFELNKRTVRAWAGLGDEVLPAAKIRIPQSFERRFEFRLLTRIDVFGEIGLRDTDCSLTLPKPLAGKPRLRGSEQLQFRYMLGAEPGLSYEIINDQSGSISTSARAATAGG
ncbi:MAG TPA: class I SAM-dependent methyltransferase [Candidatus Kapabacteria bacterium]|nr:class I SAM-dependent methyltransferase [Candidatus Kapabacteria bacterium]